MLECGIKRLPRELYGVGTRAGEGGLYRRQSLGSGGLVALGHALAHAHADTEEIYLYRVREWREGGMGRGRGRRVVAVGGGRRCGSGCGGSGSGIVVLVLLIQMVGSGDRTSSPPIRVLEMVEVELMIIVYVLGGRMGMSLLIFMVMGIVEVLVEVGSDVWLKGAFVSVEGRIVRVNVSHCEKRGQAGQAG